MKYWYGNWARVFAIAVLGLVLAGCSQPAKNCTCNSCICAPCNCGSK